MEQADVSLAIVKAWYKESLKVSGQSNDALLSLIAKSFETIKIVLAPDSDMNCSMNSIASLDNQRRAALLMENEEFNGLRHLVFGLIESLQITLHQVGKNNLPPMKEPKSEVTEYANETLVLKEVKEESGEDVKVRNSSDIAKVEKRRRSWERSINGDYSEPKEEPKEDYQAISDSNKMSSLNFKEDEMVFKEEDLLAPKNESIEIVKVIPDDSQNSSGSTKVEKRRKSSAHSINDYDVSDDETVVKKRTSESVWYDSDKTTPQCVLCEAHPESAHRYVLHLASQHKSTLKANGIYLLCSCCTSIRSARCDSDHYKNCDSREFSSHNLEEGEPTTPECIICGKRPKTINGYTEHLRSNHKATLLQNGIYLVCKCGLVVRTTRDFDPIHKTKCDGRVFKLHKVLDSTAPQCILCEAHPVTVTGYADHLVSAHNTTLFANGIHLTCSCGFVVRSRNCGTDHSKKCTGLKFSLQINVK